MDAWISEFQDSQDYINKPCQKRPKKKYKINVYMTLFNIKTVDIYSLKYLTAKIYISHKQRSK